MGSQQFCLKWNNHQLNMLTVFDQLLQNEAFVDVTIACEGLSLKAHKMVLSACSPYFQNLFMDNPCKHPIVILKDIRYDEMKAIIDFMYKGEVNVSQDQLSALLKTAEALKVKGLAEVTGQGPHGQVQQGSSQSSSAASVLFETVGSRHSPPAKRKKRPPASAAVSIGSPVSPGNSNTSHSTSSHRALSPPHPVVQSAVSLAPVPSAGSVTASGMCSGDEDQSPLVGLNRSRNMEGVPGSSKDGLSNVKEEKIEIEEPPDDVEDLIMEATPEHIEIEPSTADTGFNGSTQDQSQLANIKYGNMFNPQPSTSGTSPGSPQDFKPVIEPYRAKLEEAGRILQDHLQAWLEPKLQDFATDFGMAVSVLVLNMTEAMITCHLCSPSKEMFVQREWGGDFVPFVFYRHMREKHLEDFDARERNRLVAKLRCWLKDNRNRWRHHRPISVEEVFDTTLVPYGASVACLLCNPPHTMNLRADMTTNPWLWKCLPFSIHMERLHSPVHFTKPTLRHGRLSWPIQ